jgi:hypothetical protein
VLALIMNDWRIARVPFIFANIPKMYSHRRKCQLV